MQMHVKRISLLFFMVMIVAGATYLWLGDYLTFDSIQRNQTALLEFIDRHYAKAVLLYILIYVATGLFLPGALILTISGGMLFGTLPAVMYANTGATCGSILAFMLSRHALGHYIQRRFAIQLERFNQELSRHGPHYLLVLRILPIVPFFVVNYGAGLTRIPFVSFVWTTSIGMLPGSLIYSYFGSKLARISEAEGLFSWEILLALVLLSLFALLPVAVHHLGIRKKPTS